MFSLGWLTPAQASTVIGVEYQHANFGGATYTYSVYANGFTCTGTTADIDLQTPQMGSGWNDIVSSFRNYSYCWTKHYEHNNYGGFSVGYSPSQSYIGNAMNDRTSSIRWS